LWLIILGSTFFYGYWDWRFIPLPYCLLAVAVIGIAWMDRGQEPAQRRRRLLTTVFALLAPLVFFKYANFLYRDVYGLVFSVDHEPLALASFGGSSLILFPAPGKLIDVVLPLGISFVTFTFIGYAIDVYRRDEMLERNITLLTAAVMFFPHLIAGPVVLPKQLIPQLDSPRRGVRPKERWGAILIFAIGLAKKLIFADQIATVVNPVFRDPTSWTGPAYLLAIVGFAVQIYCDFSGYSDMAIGIAKFLGVELPRNFDRPYASASVVEFWQRWHITLSNWLRDYLYIPLGGNRRGFARQVVNVMITMSLGGLWHGARWTFLVWGVLHGASIVVAHTARRAGLRSRLEIVPNSVWVLLTFAFVTLAWIPFRAETLADAIRVLSGVFVAPWGDVRPFVAANAFPLALVALFFALHRHDYVNHVRLLSRRTSVEFGWAVSMSLIVLSLCVSAGGSADFIYFDF
jgi:alginate O-acetyltransferase complex protein AlgI